MIYYVVPGLGIYGGIKKAFQCAGMLTASGFPCVVASPEGGRPDWMPSTCPTSTRDELAECCRPEDVVLFSSPADALFVDSLPAGRKVVHMQGAITVADHELMDPARGYEYVSHGLHMTYELQLRGRVAPYVPLGISDVFRWDGDPKAAGTVAVMPRRGGEILPDLHGVLRKGERLLTIDGIPEAEVARILRAAEVFVAISQAESFGLPPLEAMCAGCCVVGYPGVGGFEFMRHGETAHVVPNGDAASLLRALRRALDDAGYRDGLRRRALAVSAYYTLDREREYLLRALGLDRTAIAP